MNDAIPLFKHELLDWTGAVMSNLSYLNKTGDSQGFYIKVILSMARSAALTLKPDRAEDLLSALSDNLPGPLEKERQEIKGRIQYARRVLRTDPSTITRPQKKLSGEKRETETNSTLSAQEAFERFVETLPQGVDDTKRQMLYDLFLSPPVQCHKGLTALLKALWDRDLAQAYSVELKEDGIKHARLAILSSWHKEAGNLFEANVLSVHYLASIVKEVFPDLAEEENPFEELEFVAPFVDPDADLGRNFDNILDLGKLLSVWMHLEKHPVLKIPALGVKAALSQDERVQKQAREETKTWLAKFANIDTDALIARLKEEFEEDTQRLLRRLKSSFDVSSEKLIERIQGIKDVPKPEELLERLKSEFPLIFLKGVKNDDPEKWFDMGNSFADTGRYHESIFYYLRAISLDPNYSMAWHNLGRSFINIGQYFEAILCYLHAIFLNHDDVCAWNSLGHSLYKTGRDLEAISCYLRAISLDQDYVHAWNGLGNSLDHAGRYLEAISCYLRAISLDQDYVFAWYNLGNSLYDTGRYLEAIPCYLRAISLDQDYVLAWNNLGISLNNTGRYLEAIPCYLRAISLDQDYVLVWNNLGNSLKNTGRYLEAISCYIRAISLDQDYVFAWYNLGLSLDKTGHTHGALFASWASWRLNPSDPVSAWELVERLFKAGFYKQAAVLGNVLEGSYGSYLSSDMLFLRFCLKNNELGRARDILESIKEKVRLLPPEDFPGDLASRVKALEGILCFLEKDMDGAMACLEEASKDSETMKLEVLPLMIHGHIDTNKHDEAKTLMDNYMALMDQMITSSLKKAKDSGEFDNECKRHLDAFLRVARSMRWHGLTNVIEKWKKAVEARNFEKAPEALDHIENVEREEETRKGAVDECLNILEGLIDGLQNSKEGYLSLKNVSERLYAIWMDLRKNTSGTFLTEEDVDKLCSKILRLVEVILYLTRYDDKEVIPTHLKGIGDPEIERYLVTAESITSGDSHAERVIAAIFFYCIGVEKAFRKYVIPEDVCKKSIVGFGTYIMAIKLALGKERIKRHEEIWNHILPRLKQAREPSLVLNENYLKALDQLREIRNEAVHSGEFDNPASKFERCRTLVIERIEIGMEPGVLPRLIRSMTA